MNVDLRDGGNGFGGCWSGEGEVWNKETRKVLYDMSELEKPSTARSCPEC